VVEKAPEKMKLKGLVNVPKANQKTASKQLALAYSSDTMNKKIIT
jgi:hypothetical protein